VGDGLGAPGVAAVDQAHSSAETILSRLVGWWSVNRGGYGSRAEEVAGLTHLLAGLQGERALLAVAVCRLVEADGV
jgi:hypothetical protein